MNYMDILKSHVINIMDSYCSYFDSAKSNSSEQNKFLIAESIFDKKNEELFNNMLAKVMECVCSYMKVDYQSITEDVYASVRANLIVKYQYNKTQGGLINEVSLLKYLLVFYKDCYGIKNKEELSQDQLNEFRNIYLEAVMDNEFAQYESCYNAYFDAQKLYAENNSNKEALKTIKSFDKKIRNEYNILDLKYARSFERFNQVIEQKDVVNTRAHFKYLFTKENMKLFNPITNANSYKEILNSYLEMGNSINLDKYSLVQNEIGLFYGREALQGFNEGEINMPLSIDALEKDNNDTIKMFDNYFTCYNEGHDKYNDYLRVKM